MELGRSQFPSGVYSMYIYWKILAALSLACVLAGGCSTGIPDPGVFYREVTVMAFGPGGAPRGPAPLTIGIEPRFSLGKTDLGKQRGAIVNKIEVDYGSGAGFADITAETKTYMQRSAQGSYGFNELIQHTYLTPGNYLVRVRMTFWDGAVLTSDEWSSAQATAE